ncbi:MAG: hypothetical protein DWQ36_10670 [Acidobacteria bacterium]|nr:MAG: hypothetical protein DWQ30_12735 [Acidobacteriota bacterium]REK07678.1 MAG: hypothetical protein DWQ36_10670 [Acidobacteriota bacterium]
MISAALAVGAFSTSALVVGHAVLWRRRAVRRERRGAVEVDAVGALERLVSAGVAGLLVLAGLLLSAAYIGALQRAVLLVSIAALTAVAVVVGGAALARDVAALVAGARRRLFAASRPRVTAASLLVVAAVALAPPFLIGLYPPHGFDALNYHLPIARSFADGGALAVLDELRFPAFPPLAELYQAALLLLADDVAAKAASLLATGLGGALLAVWAARLRDPRAGLLAAALWCGQPLVVWLAGQAYVEMWLVLFSTAGLVGVDAACRGTSVEARQDGGAQQRGGALLLGAAALAAACAVKYLGLVALALAAARLLWVLPGDAVSPRRRLGWLALLFAVAGAGMAPAYLHVWRATGSPLFPYFGSVFPAGDWSPSLVPGSAADETLAQRLIWWVSLPLTVGLSRREFDFAAPLSPLWLPLVGLIAWRWRRLPEVRFPALCAVLYGASLLLHDERRLHHLLPAAAWLCVAAGVALSDLASSWRSRRALVASLLLVAAPGVGYGWYKLSQHGVPPRTDTQREAWLARHLGGYEAVAPVREACAALEVGPEAECVIYLESHLPLRYYLPGRVLGELYGPYRRDLLSDAWRDPRRLHERLGGWGVDFLVLRPALAERVSRRPDAGRFLRTVWRGEEVAVLALERETAP